MIYGVEVGITTPKETVSTGHSKSFLMHIYSEKCTCTHSYSRHVPVHVFSCYDGESVRGNCVDLPYINIVFK